MRPSHRDLLWFLRYVKRIFHEGFASAVSFSWSAPASHFLMDGSPIIQTATQLWLLHRISLTIQLIILPALFSSLHLLLSEIIFLFYFHICYIKAGTLLVLLDSMPLAPKRVPAHIKLL